MSDVIQYARFTAYVDFNFRIGTDFGVGRKSCCTAVFSAKTGQKVGEIKDLLVIDRVEDISHRGVVAATRVVLVFPQCFHEVVLALAGEARNILFAGIIQVMAKVTAVLLDERPRPFHAGGIGGTASRLRRWQ